MIGNSSKVDIKKDEIDEEGDDIIVMVKELVHRYGDFTAIDGISFTVKRGEIFSFLGPNGAGKTFQKIKIW